MPPVVVEADLRSDVDSADILRLVNMYALDPMGGGKELPAHVRFNLIAGLRTHPTTRVFLAECEGRRVGIAVCFLGFSTFAAKPLLNIHDLAVDPDFRGRGIGKLLLRAAEEKARALGCCKLTLEVLHGNSTARQAYASFGFQPGPDDPENRGMFFLTKPLPASSL